MSSHHLTPAGEANKCEATVGTCPYGPEDHFDTPEEAAREFEIRQMGSENSALYGLQQKTEEKALQVISQTPLKDLDAAQLSSTLVYEAEQSGMNPDTIRSAATLASVLHSTQRRANRGDHETTPYIEHPLRNSIRLLRWGVKDQDVIVASILHDTVEDGSRKFSRSFKGVNEDEETARKSLKDHIRKAYGYPVEQTVLAVTNEHDPHSRTRPREEKNRIYLEHVKTNVQSNPRALLVKLADFVDNASSLHHTDTPKRREKTARQARKYLPVVQVFRNEIKRNPTLLNKRAKNEVFAQLDRTENRLKKMIG